MLVCSCGAWFGSVEALAQHAGGTPAPATHVAPERITALLIAGDLVFAPGAIEGFDLPCEGCGCTTERACPEGCWWVRPGLCSQCAETPIARPLGSALQW